MENCLSSIIISYTEPNEFASVIQDRILEVYKKPANITIQSFNEFLLPGKLDLRQIMRLEFENASVISSFLLIYYQLTVLFIYCGELDFSDPFVAQFLLLISSIHVNVGSAKDKQVLGVLDEVSHELSIRGNSFAINSLLPNIYNIGQKQQLISEFKLLMNFSIDSLNRLLKEFSDLQESQNRILSFANQLITQRILGTFQTAMKLQLPYFRMIPMLMRPSYIFEQCSRYILQECIDSHEERSVLMDGISRSEAQAMEQAVQDFNAESQMVVTKMCKFVQGLFEMKNAERRTAKKMLQRQIEDDVDETHFPSFVRVEEYKKELVRIGDILVDSAVSMIHQMVMTIVEATDLEAEQFQEFLSDAIEEVVSDVSRELRGFTDKKLYHAMKQFFFSILQDINNFLMKASRIANAEMANLEKLLTVHHTLANVRTYCVLQSEVSQLIVDQIKETLAKDFFFLIPELQIFEDQLVLQSIRYFYSYSTIEIKEFTIPMNAENFKESEQLLSEPDKKLTQGLQMAEFMHSDEILFKRFIKTHQNYETLLDFHHLSQALSYDQKIAPYLYQRSNYRVKAIQDIQNSKTGRIAISMMIGNDCKVLEINQKDRSLVLRDCSFLNYHDWDSKTKIEPVDCTLEEIIEQKRSQFDYYNSTSIETQKEQLEDMQRTRSRLSVSREEFKSYKDVVSQKKKLQQQRKYKTGNMAGISISSGLGFLIVDSLDRSIPWGEKLKRAGYITVAQGVVFGMTSIPVVGFLIQQALVAFALQRTLGNKVVSKTQKAQNLGHLGVQSSMGIGTAIAGQILIPIPVLGAIIGGTLGGIAIGLYQKLLVSKTKASIIKMLGKLQSNILEDGLIFYQDAILKILKINRDFFLKMKPIDMDESTWTTVQLVYLVNEVYFIFNLQYEEEYEKLQKELEKAWNEKILKKMHQLEIEFENVELLSAKWERSRNYIYQNKIKTLPLAEQIGTFIQGMMANFKI